MGQLLVHFLQSAQADGFAVSWSEGKLKRFRIQRPMIIKGAIQQIVWHGARFPAARANIAIAPTMAANMMEADTVEGIDAFIAKRDPSWKRA